MNKFIAEWQANAEHLERHGLYDPSHEHDACGVGLIAAIDGGHLSGAWLDVFRSEPLPSDHPFWSHPCVTVTPHVAALTEPASAAAQVIENIRRARRGREPLHRVDLSAGY